MRWYHFIYLAMVTRREKVAKTLPEVSQTLPKVSQLYHGHKLGKGDYPFLFFPLNLDGGFGLAGFIRFKHTAYGRWADV